MLAAECATGGPATKFKFKNKGQMEELSADQLKEVKEVAQANANAA